MAKINTRVWPRLSACMQSPFWYKVQGIRALRKLNLLSCFIKGAPRCSRDLLFQVILPEPIKKLGAKLFDPWLIYLGEAINLQWTWGIASITFHLTNLPFLLTFDTCRNVVYVIILAAEKCNSSELFLCYNLGQIIPPPRSKCTSLSLLLDAPPYPTRWETHWMHKNDHNLCYSYYNSHPPICKWRRKRL